MHKRVCDGQSKYQNVSTQSKVARKYKNFTINVTKTIINWQKRGKKIEERERGRKRVVTFFLRKNIEWLRERCIGSNRKFKIKKIGRGRVKNKKKRLRVGGRKSNSKVKNYREEKVLRKGEEWLKEWWGEEKQRNFFFFWGRERRNQN